MSRYLSYSNKIPWFRLIGLLLLVVLLWRLDFATLTRIVARTDPYWLALAILLNIPMVGFKALRWQTLLRSQGIYYQTLKAYLAYFGSIFIGFLTPGRLGEFVKAIHLNQDCKLSLSRAFSSVLVDRLFDFYTLLLIGGAALLTLAAANGAVSALIGSIIIFTLPIIFFLNGTTFAWVRQMDRRLGSFGQKLFGPQSWLVDLRADIRRLTGRHLLLATALTVLAYLTFFLQCYLLALALKLPLGYGLVSFAVALGSLVTLLPISISGLGTREAAIIAYLGTVGVPAEAALSFSLLVFMTFYVGGGLLGALAWWLKPVQLSRLTTKVVPS